MADSEAKKKTLLAAPDAQTWSIDRILREARSGRLLIPVFQRNFRWGQDDVKNLFDSLNRGFPIGNLLVWATDPTPNTSPLFETVEFERSRSQPGLVIIDGQQRITSLVATLLSESDSDDQRFKLYFDLEEADFKYLGSQRDVPTSWLPMTEVADTVDFLEWLQSANLTNALVRRANEVVRAIREYKIPVYEITGGASLEPLVREIFHRLNSTGKRLKETDIFNALHRKKDAAGLGTIADELRGSRFGALGERWLMKAVAAVLGSERENRLTEHFSQSNASEQESLLALSSQALLHTVDFLRTQCCIPHWSLLPYHFPIAPLAAYFARFADSSSATEKRLLKLWLWRGAVTGEHKTNSRPMIKAALDIVKSARSANEACDLLYGQSTDCVTLEAEGQHNRRTASTKIVGCALAALSPRDLLTGQPLDLEHALDQPEPFPQIVVRSRIGSHNRLLHPPLARSPRANARAMRKALRDASPSTHASHLISHEAAKALEADKLDLFLELRSMSLQRHVTDFVFSLCQT